MKLYIFITFTLITTTLGFEKLLKYQEDQVIENYFRNYPNAVNRLPRSRKVRENVLRHFYEIQNHNERFRSGEEMYEMELNEFSAQSEEDLAMRKLGFEEPVMSALASENHTEFEISMTAKNNLPDYWNWVDHGIVQPVQDQGNCGSCYAFAAIGVIESSMCRFHNNCVKLSEQEAMECTNGCNGGWDTNVYHYTNSHNGCTLASYHRYLGFVRDQCVSNTRPRVATSQSWNYQVLPNNAEAIRQFLYDNGPLFVAFDVYNNLFSYRSGIVTTTPGSRAGGHAVLLVGYGTSNGTPYWILKNSWGARWGERGYFRVIRGVNFARIESWKVSFAWTR